MSRIVGVRFKKASQIYYFDPADMTFESGDDVIVETARGLALGKVAIPPKDIEPEQLSEPLKTVVRRAQAEDFEKQAEMREKEGSALAKCEELVAKFQLPMSPLAAEYSMDGTHLTIFFKAEKRVDFRTLLRELSSALKTRVELRQVGARDAAKLVGGMGRCGFGLCCASHLCKFEPISMKMARDQDLPLNPTNISGVCGRLLCCLAYENVQYRDMKQKLPAPGKSIKTRVGEAKVIGCNPLKETVLVQLESEATIELPVSEIELPDSDSPR